MGYHRAGFDVVGVDIRPQPRYPFAFVQTDAMTYPLDGFDAVHASPPCQGYSRMRRLNWLKDRAYPMLLEPTWERLAASGVPWVIENVMDAPMPHSTVLCGWTLGLPIYRHRRFGASFLVLTPPHRKHVHVIAPGHANINGRRKNSGGVMGVLPVVPDPCGHTAGTAGPDVRAAMGIDWMTRDELTQEIPPAYTELIAESLLREVA